MLWWFWIVQFHLNRLIFNGYGIEVCFASISKNYLIISKLLKFLITAAIRVLVDGGANRWFKFIDENKLNDSMQKPHFSTGDMDSISEDSKQRLQAMDCERVETPDQDETDCTKALMVIRSHFESKKVKVLTQLLLKYSFIHFCADKNCADTYEFWWPHRPNYVTNKYFISTSCTKWCELIFEKPSNPCLASATWPPWDYSSGGICCETVLVFIRSNGWKV